MLQAPLPTTKPGAASPGPAFIRLLAGLAGAEVPVSGRPLSERLSHWFDWNQALALSDALDGKPATVAAATPGLGENEESECAQVRASLVKAIVEDPLLGASETPASSEVEADYADFRQRHIALQRSMQAATGRLRGRLRDVLAQASPELARLAEVDAVMELTLSPREQASLAGLPALLGEHFERLRQASQASATPEQWLNLFRKDVRNVLLAELEVRFQPVDGLLAALRSYSLGTHVQKSS